MDHHVPVAITGGLRRLGVDVLTAWEDTADRLPDDQLLQRATDLGRSLVTSDDDLLATASHWLREGREFNGLIYAHQLRITIGQAVRDLHLMSQVLEAGDMRNRVEFLPL